MFVAACTLKRVIRDAAGRMAANIVKPPGRWPAQNRTKVGKSLPIKWDFESDGLFEALKMIGTHIEIILVVTGATTAMALAQFIAPASVSRIIYGAAPAEVVGIALVRHWGLLVFLVGVLLIYAAFHPEVREPVMVVAAAEKITFSLVILAHPYGGTPLPQQSL